MTQVHRIRDGAAANHVPKTEDYKDGCTTGVWEYWTTKCDEDNATDRGGIIPEPWTTRKVRSGGLRGITSVDMVNMLEKESECRGVLSWWIMKGREACCENPKRGGHGGEGVGMTVAGLPGHANCFTLSLSMWYFSSISTACLPGLVDGSSSRFNIVSERALLGRNPRPSINFFIQLFINSSSLPSGRTAWCHGHHLSLQLLLRPSQ